MKLWEECIDCHGADKEKNKIRNIYPAVFTSEYNCSNKR